MQETLVRAWKAMDRFEGRSSLRSWLYKIATNVCLDMLRTPQRRARPMELGGPVVGRRAAGRRRCPSTCGSADRRRPGAPGRTATPPSSPPPARSVRLAFVAALQHLPPRQRAVLILREVLRWQATEVAELLDTTVASVNSALQRARATLADVRRRRPRPHRRRPRAARRCSSSYVDAFERYDVTALVALLRDDVQFSMPPHNMWLEGPDQVATWLLGHGFGCKGSRLVATAANGCAAFGSYRLSRPGPARAVRHPDPRVLRRAHLRDPQLPRHRAVRRIRPAGRLESSPASP